MALPLLKESEAHQPGPEVYLKDPAAYFNVAAILIGVLSMRCVFESGGEPNTRWQEFIVAYDGAIGSAQDALSPYIYRLAEFAGVFVNVPDNYLHSMIFFVAIGFPFLMATLLPSGLGYFRITRFSGRVVRNLKLGAHWLAGFAFFFLAVIMPLFSESNAEQWGETSVLFAFMFIGISVGGPYMVLRFRDPYFWRHMAVFPLGLLLISATSEQAVQILY